MKRAAAFAVAALIAAGPVLAQDAAPTPAPELDAPDWDVIERDGSLIATVAYDPGLIVGVRCRAWDLDVFLTNLPPSAEEWIRPLEIAGEAGDFYTENWVATTDPGTAFNLLPARFARALREGGVLQVRAPGPDGRRVRYSMDLPASNAAIDQVLTACRKPLVDPRDELLEAAGPVTSTPNGRDWVRQPRPQFPSTGTSRGSATLSCLAEPTGELSQCVVESEYPRDRGFGRAGLRSVGNARVSPAEDTMMVIFTIRYAVR